MRICRLTDCAGRWWKSARAAASSRPAAGDPVKQSQFSRQIKELEDFFQIRLLERPGKGDRLTNSGKELARISRFFLLGLSNFQQDPWLRADLPGLRQWNWPSRLVVPALANRQKVRYAVARYASKWLLTTRSSDAGSDLRLDISVDHWRPSAGREMKKSERGG